MAEDKKKKPDKIVEGDSKTSRQTLASKSSKKVKGRNRFTRWFREMKSELKKVVWPTPKQVMNNTLVSLTVMVAAAILVWLIDQAGGQIFQAVRFLGSR